MNSSDYTIKTGQNQYTGTAITDTTTFDLYINGIDEKVDSETVSAVANGNDSTVEGPPGPGIVSETRLYKWGSTQPTADKDGLEQSELQTYEHYKDAGFLWMYYEQTWTAGSGKTPTYTPPIRMTDYEMGTLMASRENDGQGISIAAWCEKYGRTLIDGSTIATGSVTAKQINTEGLSAEYIQSNNYLATFAPPIPPSTTGLTFTKDGDYYTVKWDGVTQIETIVVPEKYNNKLVKSVESQGFENCPANTIYFPSTMDNLSEDCLGTAVTTLYLPRIYFLYDSINMTNCTTINCLSGTEFKKAYIASGDNILQVLGLPRTLQKIEANAFASLTALHTINFVGTEQEWNAIEGVENAGISSSVVINYLDLVQGFKISSSEDELMIDSKGLQVTQEGIIHSTAGKIAGWDIDDEGIYKKIDNNVVACISSGNDSYASIVNGGGTSPIRFLAGGDSIKTVEVKETITSGKQTFIYSPPDCKKIKDATCTLANTGGLYHIDGIGTKTLTVSWNGNSNGTLIITYEYESSNFAVLEDGSLYASAADITGTIHAKEGEFEGKIIAHNGGKIGDLEIQNGGLESDLIQLNHTGLRLTGGEVSIGANSDVVINTQNEKGVWDTASQDIESVVFSSRTNKPFVIKNSGGAGIYFSNVTAHQTGEIKYSIKTDMEYKMANGERNGGYLYFKYFIENNDAFNYNHTVLLFMRLQYNGIAGTSNIYLNLTIPAYSNSGLCTIANMAGSTVGGNTLGFENNRVVFPTAPSANFASGEFYQTVREWGGAVEGPYIGFGNFASLDGDKKIFDYVYTPYRVDNNVLYSLGSFFPSKEQLSLGESNQPWDKIYSSSGTVQSSDIRLKNSIQPLSNSYEIFYDQINPVLYRLNNGTSNRLHAGFIAQEIEKALNNANISTKDFAGVCIGQDEQKTRGVRYEEFVPLNIWQIQKLKKRAAEDEQIIQRQAETIAQLEERLARIESLLEKNP